MANLLSIRNLVKSYNRKILNNLHLELEENDYLSIVGPSGSGKSTLMNIIGLLEPYDGGEYLFNNIKITTEKQRCQVRRESIGFIFQSFHLLPTLTVKENIFLPFQYNSKENLEYEKLVDRLKISHLSNQFPDELSGGERQRVAIARALITNPKLLLADEPTGNLDGVNRDQVLRILAEEHVKGKAIILITHDDEAAALATRQAELKEGKLYEKRRVRT